MANRSQVIVGTDVVLGFRHFFNGVLSDAFNIVDVTLFSPSLNTIAVIPGTSVIRTAVGTYEVVADSAFFPSAGTYRDVWRIVSEQGGPTLSFAFPINYVTSIPPSPLLPSGKTNFKNVLNCKLDDLNACEMNNHYLWPVRQTLLNGYTLPDELLQHHIDVSITYIQRALNMPLRRIRVLTRPFSVDQTPANPELGVDFEEEGELLQWSAAESTSWSDIRLPQTGILRVNNVRGVFGGRTVYKIPFDWIDRNEFKMGYVRIRPTTTGTINNIVDNSGQFLDVTLLEALGNNTVPGFWAIDYEYGSEGDQIPKEICDSIMKNAATTILEQISTSIYKGIGSRSASVDGLTSSINYVVTAEAGIFGALAKRYREEVSEEHLATLRRYYKGPMVYII